MTIVRPATAITSCSVKPPMSKLTSATPFSEAHDTPIQGSTGVTAGS